MIPLNSVIKKNYESKIVLFFLSKMENLNFVLISVIIVSFYNILSSFKVCVHGN